MHSRILNEAVENACRERVMIGKFPVCALYITIAYEAVDVNVHPNKLEVRFRDETGVYEAVHSAVLSALKERDAFEQPTQMPLMKEKEPASEPAAAVHIQIPKTNTVVSVSPVLPAEASAPKQEIPPRPVPEFRDVRIPEPEPVQVSIPAPVLRENAEQVNTILPAVKKPMKVFGALFNTFILVEYEDQLLMVDQHAVHERLLFDRLMKEHASGDQAGQELLVPIVIGVTKAEQRLLEDNRDALESIGMVVEAFGEQDVAVRTIPMILGETQTREFVRDIIEELQNGRDPTFEKRRASLLQTACKHAVSPHGRPLVVAITHRELDKKFKRIQK